MKPEVVRYLYSIENLRRTLLANRYHYLDSLGNETDEFACSQCKRKMKPGRLNKLVRRKIKSIRLILSEIKLGKLYYDSKLAAEKSALIRSSPVRGIIRGIGNSGLYGRLGIEEDWIEFYELKDELRVAAKPSMFLCKKCGQFRERTSR